MEIEEIINEEWVALFAPDGSFQAATLTPDFQTCVANIKLLHKAKMGRSYMELTLKGFKIMPVRLTMIQNGDEQKAFQDGKNKLQ